MSGRQRGGNALWIGLALAGAGAATASCAALIGIDDRLPDDVVEAGVDAPPSTACASGESCIAPPEGWTVVAFDRGASACPPGYGERQDLSFGPSTCDCTCEEVARGSCGSGTVTIRQFTFADCNTNNFRSELYTAGDGGCTPQPYPYDGGDYARFGNSSVIFQPATCGDAGGDASPKPPEPARTCKPSGSSCDDGGTCAAPVGPNERLCVEKPGDQTCPEGFPDKLQAGTTPGADTRKCATCTCDTSPTSECGKAELDLYATSDCTGPQVAIGVGFCAAYDGGTAFPSYKFKWPEAPRCVPTSKVQVVAGSLSFQDGVTICCRP